MQDSAKAGTYTTRVFNFTVCDKPDCRFSMDLKTHCVVEEKPGGVELRWDKHESPQNSDEAVAISYTWGRYGLNYEALQRSTDVNNGNDAEDALKYPPKLFNTSTIGHWSRDPSQKVELQLGSEWQTVGDSMPSFADALQRICQANKYCWIDQLSLPQGGDVAAWEQRKKGIENIPKIFRAFEVIVVLPGAMCECVKNPVNHSLPTFGHCDRGEFMQKVTKAVGATGFAQFRLCYNNLGAASYFQRIWPRQEMFYARRIRLEWASQNILKCNSPAKPHALGLWWPMMVKPAGKGLVGALKGACRTRNWHGTLDGFLNSMYRHPDDFVDKLNVCVAKHWNQHVDTNHIDNHFALHFMFGLGFVLLSAFNDADNSMIAWSLRRNVADEEIRMAQNPKRLMVLAHFLSGKPLVREDPRDDPRQAKVHDSREIRRLHDFLELLDTLAYAYRECTWPTDLINAVWMDCPGYKGQDITGQGTEVVTALERAVCDTLEGIWRISPITTLPSGLFDKMSRSDDATTRNPLVWRPSLCRDLEKVYTDTTIYGGLGSGTYATKGSWVLAVKDKPVFSIPWTASSSCHFHDLHSHVDMKPHVLLYVIQAFKSWPADCCAKIFLAPEGWGAARTPNLAHETTSVSFEDAMLSWMHDTVEDFEVGPNDERAEAKYTGKIFRMWLLKELSMGRFSECLDAILGSGNLFTWMERFEPKLQVFYADNELPFNEIFEIVCSVIGLEVKVAKRNSSRHHGPFHLVLDTVLDQWDANLPSDISDYDTSSLPRPRRIGLSRINYDLEDRPTTYTVCLTPPEGFISGPGVMLEVMLLDAEGNPRKIPPGERERTSDFEITGVWVMPADYAKEDVFEEITGQLVEGKMDISNDDVFENYLKGSSQGGKQR